MTTAKAGFRITFKHIQYLTDFSEASEVALRFAVATAREFGATIHALHVLIPQPYFYMTPETVGAAIDAAEENAQKGMERVEAQLAGMPHDATIIRESDVWSALETAIASSNIDFIVLGTRGRTGAEKVLLGSVAEEIFRRSFVPVMTIGPHVRNAIQDETGFKRILFATDFTAESLAAMPYAVSFAEENEAQLVLLHVIQRKQNLKGRANEKSIANAMHELLELVPKDAEQWCRPDAIVDYGEPADRILQAATERDADLIVLGVRDATSHLGTATHIGNTVAHKIVTHATCPVVTVREPVHRT